MIKRIVVGSAIAAGSWAAYSGVRQWYRTWGIDPAEAEKVLPGDELVAEPTDLATAANQTTPTPADRLAAATVSIGS